MLKKNVQNLINNLEGEEFYLNGFNCKVEKGSLYWNSTDKGNGIIDIDSLSIGDLSELYNQLIDVESTLKDSQN